MDDNGLICQQQTHFPPTLVFSDTASVLFWLSRIEDRKPMCMSWCVCSVHACRNAATDLYWANQFQSEWIAWNNKTADRWLYYDTCRRYSGEWMNCDFVGLGSLSYAYMQLYSALNIFKLQFDKFWLIWKFSVLMHSYSYHEKSNRANWWHLNIVQITTKPFSHWTQDYFYAKTIWCFILRIYVDVWKIN